MPIIVWGGFLALILALLALDLGVFHKRDEAIGTREALVWTGIWVVVSLLFAGVVYALYSGWVPGIAPPSGLDGRSATVQYVTGYLIEKSLSFDNIFVISLVFEYFRIPLKFQHRVLFWGILGALLARGLMIGLGTALITQFSWTVYIFGAFLLFTAGKMMFASDESIDPSENPLVKLVRRIYPVSTELDGHRFFTHDQGRRAMTPLMLVLIVVESSDVIFAVDSIPAIFAVTRDPFLVFTSNIFAILGLRSLYFAIASLLDRFRYLKQSLVFVLAYVGVKMLASHHFPIPPEFSLLMILGVLGIGVVASTIAARRAERHEREGRPDQR